MRWRQEFEPVTCRRPTTPPKTKRRRLTTILTTKREVPSRRATQGQTIESTASAPEQEQALVRGCFRRPSPTHQNFTTLPCTQNTDVPKIRTQMLRLSLDDSSIRAFFLRPGGEGAPYFCFSFNRTAVRRAVLGSSRHGACLYSHKSSQPEGNLRNLLPTIRPAVPSPRRARVCVCSAFRR